MSIKKHFN